MKKSISIILFFCIFISVAFGYTLKVNDFTVDVTDGRVVTITAEPKDGYSFSGWEVVSGDLTLDDTSNETTTFSMPKSDIEVKSHYTINTTLTVNPGDTKYTQMYNTTRYVTAPKPLVESNFVTFNYNGNGSDSKTVEAKNVFYNWTLSGGGSISSATVNPVKYTYGEEDGTLTANYKMDNVMLPSPTREGYKFNGWYTASSGGTKVGAGGDSYTVNGDITLYAQWEQIGDYNIDTSPIQYAETLSSAISLCGTSGNTITLEANVTDNTAVTVPVGKSVTLDLAGKTIETTANPFITVQGTLTIIDSASGGSITSSTNSMKLINVESGGILTVLGGTLSATGSSSHGIYGETDTTITLGLDDGTISTSLPSVTGSSYGILCGGNVNYYDGVVKGGTQSIHANITTPSGTLFGEETDATTSMVTSKFMQSHVVTNLARYYDGRQNAGANAYNSSTTAFVDLTGTQNGAIYSATWNNGALKFDGTDDGVALGEANYANPTLEAVFTYDEIKSTNHIIMDTFNNGGYVLGVNTSGQIMFWICIDGEWKYVTSAVLEPGQKYHVVGTYDGTEMNLYVNNVKVNSLAYSGTITNPTAGTVLKMGVRSNTNTEYLKGSIYMARIYDGALTQAQVTQNYQAAMAAKMNTDVHTGGTVANNGTCTICGARYITINSFDFVSSSANGYSGYWLGEAGTYDELVASKQSVSYLPRILASAPIDLGTCTYSSSYTDAATYSDGIVTTKTLGGVTTLTVTAGTYTSSSTWFVYNTMLKGVKSGSKWSTYKAPTGDDTFNFRVCSNWEEGYGTMYFVLRNKSGYSNYPRWQAYGMLGGNATSGFASYAYTSRNNESDSVWIKQNYSDDTSGVWVHYF